MVKSAYLSKRIKETPLKKEMWNEYHWGRSGTGKTYTYIKKCEQYSLEEVYLCNDYSNSGSSGGGFDFYANNPAKIVILDEFRGNMPYEKILNILDVYSRKQQHCRYQNVYQLWTSVIVCSIYPPEQVYDFMVDEKHRNIDSIEQFMRRFNVIVYHYINKDGKYRTFEMPSCDYINAQDMIQRARENEKYADSLERLENEPIEEAPIDIEEFKKQWNAVEVK